jgi:SAM-dependent methyltransferase
MSNLTTYENAAVVGEYATADELQPAERAAISMLGDALRNMKMLDVGVGGGRTTVHFSPLVREYTGVDYSRAMIDACAKRFPELAARNAFHVCDARAMDIFPDGVFDFVLFSFNGIDYVSAEDRLRILNEVARVSRNGARFLFSTHNLNSDAGISFVRSEGDGIREIVRKSVDGVRFRMMNRGWQRKREQSGHMVLNDGAHDFGLKTLYIKASAQTEQLRNAGFTGIRIIARNGDALDSAQAERSADPWLHYLATVTKSG